MFVQTKSGNDGGGVKRGRTDSASQESRAGEFTCGDSKAMEMVLRRLNALELITAAHDDHLRELDAWSMVVLAIPSTSQLAKELATAMENWQGERPSSGPHPWGPPRWILGKGLHNFVVTKE
eukprot:TRINITY_DN7952_c0_g2_i4.p2 TRINITY_DN7952_c0_g2~~TRINITY_DN7952_c0_g2_i4.p2  ORF type:complete len:122 (+),score=30.91 TRINITY_DN7952_c0_g2_i4:169-534(+)